MRQAIAAMFIILLLAPALHAATGTHQERRIERLIASPTPLGPFSIASDAARYDLDIPEGVVVLVDARGSDTAPFYFTFHRAGQSPPSATIPTSIANAQLAAGKWHVIIDPAAGGNVDIRVRFTGYVGAVGGAAAAFSLTDAGRDGACVIPGVCLP